MCRLAYMWWLSDWDEIVFRALIVLFHGYNIEIYKIIKATLLTLHFLSYAKFFCRSKGGPWPKWPNGKYASGWVVGWRAAGSYCKHDTRNEDSKQHRSIAYFYLCGQKIHFTYELQTVCNQGFTTFQLLWFVLYLTLHVVYHNINNNNNNNNTQDNVYGAVIMSQVISRVYPVHLTNVGQHQAAANPQTKPTNFGCKSACRLLSFIIILLVIRTQGSIEQSQHIHTQKV